ncbi:hypothetical protein LTR17_026039, partial [Elasticomyces elasticus]
MTEPVHSTIAPALAEILFTQPCLCIHGGKSISRAARGISGMLRGGILTNMNIAEIIGCTTVSITTIRRTLA